VHNAIRQCVVFAATLFAGSALADYVVNRIDYFDAVTGAKPSYSQLWSNNSSAQAVGYASFDGGVTFFGFVYDPSTGNYMQVPLPPGYDGVTSGALPIGINDAGVMTGGAFDPTGTRGFILENGVYTFFSHPSWANTYARTISNPTAAHPKGFVVGYVDDGIFETSDSTSGFIYDVENGSFAPINDTNSFITIAHGQNWAPSVVTNGTPGAPNSVVQTNIAPLILNVQHLPPIPRSVDGVLVTAQLLDERSSNLAATLFRLTVEEAIAGVTREAARALGRLNEIGTLEPGKRCDLAIWNIERPAELVYRIGFNPLHARVWGGK